MDDEDRRAILGRRARWIAAALTGMAGPACAPSAPATSTDVEVTASPTTPPPAPTATATATAVASSANPSADQDGDGVPDESDPCPTLPGTVGAVRGIAGCPAPCLSIRQTVEIHQRVDFERGSARLLPRHTPLLDDLAKALVGHPEISVTVDGHTSKDESAALALARAKVVLEALATRGVPKDHMEAKAFGASRPRTDGSTAALQAENRRVEFTVVAP